jgi:hypothetical protein
LQSSNMTVHCGFISRDRGYPPDLFKVRNREPKREEMRGRS